jgi:cell wall-associated NlpC family hydrolase
VTRRHSARHRATATRDHPGLNLRSAAVAAGSGLALLIATPAAVASPEIGADLERDAGDVRAAGDVAAAGESGSARAALTAPQTAVARYAAQVRAARLVTPTVVVPADAAWTIASTPVAGEKPPPPPPPPPPAPVVRREIAPAASTASRSRARAVVAAPAPRPAAAPSVSGNAVLEIAYRYLGVPYVYGGSTPAGFDCSGFTQYVYAQLGISLPRTSSAQRYAGTVVSAADARPGDLMWYPGHIGIYVGDGQYIGARRPGTALSVGPIYYANPTFIRVS